MCLVKPDWVAYPSVCLGQSSIGQYNLSVDVVVDSSSKFSDINTGSSELVACIFISLSPVETPSPLESVVFTSLWRAGAIALLI